MALLIFCPLHQAYVALCQAPPGASLLQPGWGVRSRGEGVLVAASRLRYWDGIPFLLPLEGSSCPCHSLWEGSGDLGRGTSLWKYLNGVSLSSTSIPLFEFQPPFQAPCLPTPPPA